MVEVNIPQMLAELTAAFEDYERARPHTLRYGVKELLYSHAEIARFRRARGAVDQRRSLRNTRITTFGRDFGVANTEYVPFGSDRIGRQSQTWVRTDGGWKIVSAHVSFLAGS
jgi:1-carboxybiuret hydrolase subunit AtzH-like protein